MKSKLTINRTIVTGEDKREAIKLEVRFKNVKILDLIASSDETTSRRELTDGVDQRLCMLMCTGQIFRSANIFKRIWMAIWNG